jgi:hypothetical protein
VNLLQCLLANLSDEGCSRFYADVHRRFGDWGVLLPLTFALSARVAIPDRDAAEACGHLFPAVLRFPETLELFAGAFRRFARHFGDGLAPFFAGFVSGSAKHSIPDSRIISFAVEAPRAFFEAAASDPRFPNLLDMLFQRWVNPNRVELLKFLLFIVERAPRLAHVDFERVFNGITERMLHVGNCKQFLVVGTETGDVSVIAKDPPGIIWQCECFANPVSMVSVAPNGQRFIVVSMRDKLVTWVVHGKQKEPFALAGTMTYTPSEIPAVAVWKGDSKVSFKAHGEVLQEVAAPRGSFPFARLMGRGAG